MITEKMIRLRSHNTNREFKNLHKKKQIDNWILEKRVHQEKDTHSRLVVTVKNKTQFIKNNIWTFSLNNKSNKIITLKRLHWKKLQIVEVGATY